MTTEELAAMEAKLASGWKLSPPNPMFRREWMCSLESGPAWLSAPFPGGDIGKQDAQDLIDWLELILKGLRRKAE